MTWSNKQELTVWIARHDPCWSSYPLAGVSPIKRMFWLQCQDYSIMHDSWLTVGQSWQDYMEWPCEQELFWAEGSCAYDSHLGVWHFCWLHKKGSRCESPAVCLDAEEFVLSSHLPPNCFPEIRQNKGSWLKVSFQVEKRTVLAVKKYLNKFFRDVACSSVLGDFASKVFF